MAVALEVQIADVPATARELRRQAARLQRRITGAANRVVQHTLQPRLVALTPHFMPSGYAPVLAASIEVRTSMRFVNNPGVTARVSAPTGGPKGRAVRALETGDLRHPLFGNKKHWYRQHVKAGLARTALRQTRGAIIDGLDHELGDIVRELAT